MTRTRQYILVYITVDGHQKQRTYHLEQNAIIEGKYRVQESMQSAYIYMRKGKTRLLRRTIIPQNEYDLLRKRKEKLEQELASINRRLYEL